jgi:hypothetical protein
MPVGIDGPELMTGIPIDGTFREATMVQRIRIGDLGM